MARILYTVVDGKGLERAGFVEAETLVDAERILRAQGCGTVRFYSDPISQDVVEEDPEVSLRGVRNSWTSVAPRLIGWWLVVALAVGMFLWIFGVGLVGVLAIGGLVASATVIWFVAPLILFLRVRVAMDEGRYATALRLVVPLRTLIRLRPAIATLDDALLFEHARVLATLDRLPESLQLVAHLERGTHSQRALHTRQLPTLYDGARDYETMFRLQRAQAESSPDAPVLIDAALTAALRFEDHAVARSYLERSRGLATSELGVAFQQLVESLCVYAEGDAVDALRKVDEAEARYTRSTSTNVASSSRHLFAWHRARCVAATGNPSGARAELAKAQPYLLANREHALLDRARAAIEKAESAQKSAPS